MVKLRNLVSQLCAVFPYYCLQFTNGSINGFTTILIAELHKADSEIPTTLDQLSWFASLNILKILSSLIVGLSTHHLGTRLTTLASAAIYIISLLLFHQSTSAMNVLISGTISMIPVTNTVTTPYTSEISELEFRASLLAITQLAYTVGGFFSLLLGSLVYWRTVALVNLIFPILTAVIVLMTPNSPVWLASRGRIDEAEKALCWIRGWVQPVDVETEFHCLIKNAEMSAKQQQKVDEKLLVTLKERLRNFIQPFVERSFYRPFVTIIVIFSLYEYGGLPTSSKYATVVFRKINSPIDESVATAIMGLIDVIGNLIVLLLVRRVGMRKLVCFFTFLASLCLMVIALIIGFFDLHGKYYYYYLWIPTIAMIVASFAKASGIGVLALTLNSEIFPTQIRYLGTSIGISMYQILSGLMSKGFLYIVEAVTLPGAYLGFAVVNVVASVVYYFLFPVTDGKSLKEIEDHFNGIRQ